MKHVKLYNLGVFLTAALVAVIFFAKPTAGSARLVSVSGCSSCDGAITYPAQASEDTKVRRMISRQGMDPAAFTLAKGVAGDFWISGDKVCAVEADSARVRCHDHFQ